MATVTLAESAKLTQDDLVPMIIQALPYPEHISNWDSSRENAVYFTWRHDDFKVEISHDGLRAIAHTTEHNKHFIAGSNLAILLESALKRQKIEMLSRELRKEGLYN